MKKFRKEKVDKIFNAIFDEPFGEKREEAEINITKVLKSNDTPKIGRST